MGRTRRRVPPRTSHDSDAGGHAPGSCRFLNWRYEPLRWEDPAVRAAWDGLVLLARDRGGVRTKGVRRAMSWLFRFASYLRRAARRRLTQICIALQNSDTTTGWARARAASAILDGWSARMHLVHGIPHFHRSGSIRIVATTALRFMEEMRHDPTDRRPAPIHHRR
jgi:hypothetical protein